MHKMHFRQDASIIYNCCFSDSEHWLFFLSWFGWYKFILLTHPYMGWLTTLKFVIFWLFQITTSASSWSSLFIIVNNYNWYKTCKYLTIQMEIYLPGLCWLLKPNSVTFCYYCLAMVNGATNTRNVDYGSIEANLRTMNMTNQ